MEWLVFDLQGKSKPNQNMPGPFAVTSGQCVHLPGASLDSGLQSFIPGVIGE